MTKEYQLLINGEPFEISETHQDWVWIHLASDLYTVIKDGGYFTTETEAMQEAMNYVHDKDIEERRRDADELTGKQLRDYYTASING